MPEPVLVTRQFVKDIERLSASLRKRFLDDARVFYENPFDGRLSTEKIHAHVGSSDVYSCRLNRAHRFIWTTELSPARTLRLAGEHDSTYRRAETMPALQGNSVRSLEEAFSSIGEGDYPPVTHIASDIRAVCEQGDLARPSQATDQLLISNASVEESTDVFELNLANFEELLKGNIASWMLFLPPHHREFIERSFNGPARVSGPSGSGKTVLLLHRALRQAARDGSSRVLVICYNIGLSRVLSLLLDRLCGFDKAIRNRIEVHHLDGIAAEVCDNPLILDERKKRRVLCEACSLAAPVRLRLRFEDDIDEFLEREIGNWIKGSPGITRDSYRNLKFPSNHAPLSVQEREEVLNVWENYERLKGVTLDWEDLRNRALSVVSNPANHRFSGVTSVLVDEYQDLSVSALELVTALARPCPQSIFFCVDERQRIYRTSSSFRQLGIEIRGRALTLDTNYRNTRQICTVAAHIARAMNEENPDGTLATENLRQGGFEGPKPMLAGFSGHANDEFFWIANMIHGLLDKGYTLGEIGVLCPNWELQDICSKTLAEKSLASFIFNRDTAARFFEDTAIKISTYHQAKGLEYKVVFCSGLSAATFRKEFRYRDSEGRNTLDSLLYMAITRARDRLYLSFTGTPLRWICTLDDKLVELKEDADTLILRGQYRLDDTAILSGTAKQQLLF